MLGVAKQSQKYALWGMRRLCVSCYTYLWRTEQHSTAKRRGYEARLRVRGRLRTGGASGATGYTERVAGFLLGKGMMRLD